MVRAAVTSDSLRRKLDGRFPPRILDVRSPEEFAQFHLPAAVNIPAADLDMRCDELDPTVDLVVVSEHGLRSYRACEWLSLRGYSKVVNLVGGLAEFRFPHG